jgi:hypothetical protein
LLKVLSRLEERILTNLPFNKISNTKTLYDGQFGLSNWITPPAEMGRDPLLGIGWVKDEANRAARTQIYTTMMPTLAAAAIMLEAANPVHEVHLGGAGKQTFLHNEPRTAVSNSFGHHASRGTNISRGIVVSDVALDLAAGNYGQAAFGTGLSGGLEFAHTSTGEKSILKGLQALGFAAKRVTGLGAIVTTGFVLHEMGQHALKSEWQKMSGALVAGAAEVLGNTVGFGLGDVAREGVRQLIVIQSGEQNAPEKSGIRAVAENGWHLFSKPAGSSVVPNPNLPTTPQNFVGSAPEVLPS